MSTGVPESLVISQYGEYVGKPGVFEFFPVSPSIDRSISVLELESRICRDLRLHGYENRDAALRS